MTPTKRHSRPTRERAVELPRRVHDTDCIRGEDEGLHDEVTLFLADLRDQLKEGK